MSAYQKPPTTNHDLRQKLLTCIDKLSDRATFTQSSNELTHLAKSLSPDHLPTFLSCILTVDSSSKSPVKLHCLSLISLLSQTHSSSSLSPHLPKLLSSLLTRLRDPHSSVRAAVSSTTVSLAPHNPTLIIHTLLNSISTEQNLNAQSGGCVCLKEVIHVVEMDGGDELLELMKKVLRKMVKLVKVDSFKAKAGLLGVMVSVVSVNGRNVINGKSEGHSVVSCGVEMLSSEDWCARKAAAEVLQVVADVGDVQFLANVKGFVVTSLESRRFDKVKVTRETMNRAWESWKEIPGDQQEMLPLPKSNSSVSKDYGSSGGSPPLPRRSSFAGSEAYKPKKTMMKSRSSLSDGPTAFKSLSMSSSTQENIGREMPQRKQTLSKSRSSLSDDSTITDSSSVSKSSYDFGFETPQSNKQMSKTRLSLPGDLSESKRTPLITFDKKSKEPSDWKVEMAVPSASSSKFESEDEMESKDKIVEVTSSSYGSRSSEERIQKTGFRYRTQVNPTVKEDEAHTLDVRGGPYEQVAESMAESEELSLIRNQLRHIERQQSDLLDLVQGFMGNSQNGIDSLETRVSGLERALDVISHDLAVQTGRIPNNGSIGSTCCPSTEFLSPKFWRRTEGKSSNSKPSYHGNVPNKDTSAEALQMDEGKSGDSWRSVEINNIKSVKGMNQTTQRGRTWSPKSIDTASTTAFTIPVVRGA